MNGKVVRHGRPDIATAKPGWRRTRQRIGLLPRLDGSIALAGQRHCLDWTKTASWLDGGKGLIFSGFLKR